MSAENVILMYGMMGKPQKMGVFLSCVLKSILFHSMEIDLA